MQLLHRRLQELLPHASIWQKSRTSFGPISALQVNLVPSKRCNCRFLAACTLLRIVLESSTLRLSASFAHFNGADLSGANLSEAQLQGADLMKANLNGADLSKANLTGAKVSQDQLNKAKSLKGTIMPNGTVHP